MVTIMKWTVPLLAAVLTACASQARLEQPNLSVVGIEMLEGSLFTQRLKVRVRVQNPNDRELPIKGVSAKLEVAGNDFATGVSAQPFVVPAFGEAEFDLMVDASMVETIIGMVGGKQDAPRDSVDYRLSGKVSLSSGLVRSLPFDEKGTLQLK